MSDKLGQVFEGTVSGVTEFGLYVEINENKCEGMVPLRDLDDDYYEFDERNYCLWGRKYHHRYSLGDTVQVKVAKANLEKKQLAESNHLAEYIWHFSGHTLTLQRKTSH